MGAGPSEPSNIEFLRWLEGSEPTWTSWTIGLLLGVATAAYGGHGLIAKLRGRPPDKYTPAPLPALGYIAFGGWILTVFSLSRLPQ